MRRFNKLHAQEIVEAGIPMVRVPVPVFMQLQPRKFEVETETGVLEGAAGDYVCWDTLAGRLSLVRSREMAHFELADSYEPPVPPMQDAS